MLLVYLAVAWVAGICLGSLLNLGPLPVLALAGLGALSAGLFRQQARVRTLALCFLMLCLGCARLQWAARPPGPVDLAFYNDQPSVVLTGIVMSEPEERGQSVTLRLQVETLALPAGLSPQPPEEQPVTGLALVTAPPGNYAYGDRLQVEGHLSPVGSDHSLSYRDRLARQGVQALVGQVTKVAVVDHHAGSPLYGALYAAKDRLGATIFTLWPQPEAGLLNGILLGDDRRIPDGLKDRFNATGTSHIYAISGFNMSIVAALFMAFAGKILGRRRAIVPALAGLWLYTLMVGAEGSVVRAAIMWSILLLGELLYRQYSTPASLAAAAILITGWNPFDLWDVGLQLSFAATAGLVIWAPPLEAATRRFLESRLPAGWVRPVLGFLGDALLLTTAAQIATLPLTWYYFQRLSPVSLLANLLILPVQSAVMLLGGMAALAGVILPGIAVPLSWFAWLPLTWTVRAVVALGTIPGAAISTAPITVAAVVAYYVGVLGLTGWLSRPAEWRRTAIAWVTGPGAVRLATLGLLAALLLAWAAVFALPDGYLHLVVFDRGHGTAALLITPRGRQILIGSGPASSDLSAQLGAHLPFWDQDLDLILLTRPPGDESSALRHLPEHYQTSLLLAPGLDRQRIAPDWWLRWSEHISPTLALPGTHILLEDDLALSIPGAPGTSPDSLAVRIEYGNAAILLAGDLEPADERDLLNADAQVPAKIISLPGGYQFGAGGGLPLAARPDLILLPAADAPTGGSVRVGLNPVRVVTVPEGGSVDFTADGKRMWLNRQP